MLVAAAVVPTAPLLVPAVAAGSAGADEELRAHVLQAVTALLDQAPDRVVVVGCCATAGRVTGTWDWSGFGVPVRGGPGPALPLALGIGDWLLDEAGWTGGRAHHGVVADAPPERCAADGRALVDGPDRVALLVCGGGSACRTEKAPGYLDPRAEAFDTCAATALGGADLPALLRLGAEPAGALMADGRAPWQVLAGAAGRGRWQGELLHDEVPYGVAYLVAVWRTQADRP